MVRRVGALALFFLLLSTTAFAIPLEMVFENRQEGGMVFVTGKTNLPDGTRIGVTLAKKVGYFAQDYEIFVKDGRFESIGFTYRGYAMSGHFELSVMSYFNENWQKPDVLKKLSQYESPSIKDGRLRITQRLSFRTSNAEKPGNLAALRAELDLLKKYLETLKGMRAELQNSAKDRKIFYASPAEWNQKLEKERGAFLKDFGKNAEEYKGGCINAYREISEAQGNLAVLWQKYDEFLRGVGEIDDLTGKMKPDPELEMQEMIERTENSIEECSP
jgi:hypothetical protein